MAGVSRGSADADRVVNQLENLRLNVSRQLRPDVYQCRKPVIRCSDRTSFRTVCILQNTAIAVSHYGDSTFGYLVRVPYPPVELRPCADPEDSTKIASIISLRLLPLAVVCQQLFGGQLYSPLTAENSILSFNGEATCSAY